MLITLFVIFVTYGFANDEINDFDLKLNDDILFEQFKEKFNKEYKNEEEEKMRKQLFISKLKEVREHNSKEHINEWGITIFSDKTKEELPQLKPIIHEKDYLKNMKKYTQNKRISTEVIPDNYFSCDSKGDDLCGTVMDQGICESCYAASVANEAQIKYSVLTLEQGKKKKEVFSTQQLIDCYGRNTLEYPKNGCNGGFSDIVLYATEQLALNSSYPYEDYYVSDKDAANHDGLVEVPAREP